MVYVLNPNWRKKVKPRSAVAKFAAEYVNWGPGAHILPSQVHFFNNAFEQDEYGHWKYSDVAENAPRQNSKTKKATALITYAMYVNHSHIFVSAHESDAVKKIYEDVFDTIGRNPELKAELDKHGSGTSKQFISLATGGMVVFRSRKNSLAGLGGTYDIVVFDEAQELRADYASMVSKTLMTKKNMLTIYLGTPFLPNSQGDIFNRIIDGADSNPNIYAVRYGIDDDNAPIEDKRLWKKTNPLYPDVISDRAFENAVAEAYQGGEEGKRDFRIQVLGLWWKDKIPPAIPLPLWNKAVKDVPNDPATNVAAIVFDPICGRLALSIASSSAETHSNDGDSQKWEYVTGEILGERSQNDSWDWLAETVGSMPRKTDIILDAGGLNKAIEAILPNNMHVIHLSGSEFLASQQGFYDMIESGKFKHTNQPDLMAEVRNAQKVKSGEMWKFSNIDKSKSIAGLKALSEAAWYRSVNVPQEQKPTVIYV